MAIAATSIRMGRAPGRSVGFWAILILLGVFAFPLMTSLAEEPAAAPAPLDPITQTEQTLLVRINEVRASYDLPPMRYNAQLSQAAKFHVGEGAARNYLAHRGADGSSYYDRVARTGFLADKVNECIGWGYNLDRMVTWWLNSPVHRSIILSPTYTEIGIGYQGNPDRTWGHWWVLNVATPSATAAVQK